jgi:bifunctional oligoribonuclease and PAP phosphatase NrnA
VSTSAYAAGRPAVVLAPREADQAMALDLIRTAISGGWVLCIGHIQPDADALGSALALAFAIGRAGGHALVSFDPGPLAFGLPPSLRFLPGEQLLTDPERLLDSPDSPAAVITFDTGSVERLGRLAPFTVLRSGGPPVLMIDHHARGERFGTLRYIDPGAAATAELVAGLIDGLGVSFNADIASCLYAALASDTGSFRSPLTSPASHRLAARLLEGGARHAAINTLMWDTRPPSYLAVLAGALGRVESAGEVIWTSIATADLEAAGASAEEAEGIVDIIRVSRDHQVAVVLKEEAEVFGRRAGWNASVRSRGRLDVGAACTALGGGGHRLAAGFSAKGQPAEIIERFCAALADTA